MHQGSLKESGYVARLADGALSHTLDVFPAVEVAGPMWCGKTWTSLAYGESVARLGQPQVRVLAEADPGLALVGAEPHVIDEWQDVPEVWDAVRAAVDEAPGRRGRFILTGSSTPAKERVAHSGAGRIGRIRMHTMTFFERGLSRGNVSLARLFGEEDFEPFPAQTGLATLAREICHGGWPAMMHDDEAVAGEYVDEYIQTICEVNLPRRGVRADEARAVLASLARNEGTAARLSTLAEDAFQARAAEASTRYVSRDLAALESLYLLDELRGWDAPVRAKTRLRTSAKRYLCDPSMAVRVLGVGVERLCTDGQLFGQLFEAQVIHDLRAYAEAAFGRNARVFYYRDADGLEVDAIVELTDGRWAGIEVKLGDSKVGDAARNLMRLRRKVAANPAARNPEPSFMAVIVGACSIARYQSDEGIYVFPLTVFGP